MSEWHEQALEFECHGDRLLGIVHGSSSSTRCMGVLVVVGGPQYRVGSHRQFVLLARFLASRGIPVLRFDYRGMGDSRGEPRNFENIGDDIRAALDSWSRKDPLLSGFVVWGLCDAASAAFTHAAADPRVKGIIAANPWVRSAATEARSYVRHYYAARLFSHDFWRKVLSGRVRIGKSITGFAASLLRARNSRRETTQPGDFRSRMLDGLRRFSGPVLLVLSGRDLVAREFEDLVKEMPQWKMQLSESRVTVERLPAADHTFSDRRDLDRVSQLCAAWLERMSGEMSVIRARTGDGRTRGSSQQRTFHVDHGASL